MFPLCVFIVCLKITLHSTSVPSGPPTNVSAALVLSTNFTLTWHPPAAGERNGIITGYNISITSLSSPFEDALKYFTTSLTITVDSLDPHTAYICTVAANTVIGMGPYSIDLFVRTQQDGRYCTMFIVH